MMISAIVGTGSRWVAAPQDAVASTARAAQELPRLDPVDCRFLTQLARRTMEAKLDMQVPAAPAYVPPTLANLTCQMVVTLREHGYSRGIGVSDRKPIIEACMQAALLALGSSQFGVSQKSNALAKIRVECQVLSQPVPYTGTANWTQEGVLDEFIEPGFHGVRIGLDGEERWFTPAELIARNIPFPDAMRTLGKEISLDSRVIPEGALARFTSQHWCELEQDGEIALLYSGLSPLGIEALEPTRRQRAVSRLRDYLIYRQQPDGSFVYEYEPSGDLYTKKVNAVAQSGTVWALSALAGTQSDPRAGEAARRGYDLLKSRLLPLGTNGATVFVPGVDDKNDIGCTAELILALTSWPALDPDAHVRNGLLAALLWLQRPEGHFVPSFPPHPLNDAPDRAAGQAMLALAATYERQPTRLVRDALERAFDAHRNRVVGAAFAPLSPWMITAYARMATATRRQDYTDLVYLLADRLVRHQVRGKTAGHAILNGAIVIGPSDIASATTAIHAHALAAAAVLARSRGDTSRSAIYRDASDQALRFVLQLQVRPEECFYMRSPEDAIHGIRSSPTNSRIRLDSVQHALLALLANQSLLTDG